MRFNIIPMGVKTGFLRALLAAGLPCASMVWAQHHAADLNQNFVIERPELERLFTLPEWRQDVETKLLRAVQLHNAGGYLPSPSSWDGFTPASLAYVALNLTNNTIERLEAVPDGGWTDEHKTTKLVLRRIPAGTFTMGSPAGEPYRAANETQHEVTITRDFFIGVFQVTQRQWELVMGGRPNCWFNNAEFYMTRPVEHVVTHANAVLFAARLRERFAGAIDLRFDLPTEAQWEYACRAGSATSLNNGTDVTDAGQLGYPCPNLGVVGRYLYNGGQTASNTEAPRAANTDYGTAAVGSLAPNAWGLYDMHGNVQERCLDFLGAYPADAVVDPVGAASGNRVLRGGAWSLNVGPARSAARRNESNSTTQSIGMRVCASLP